MPGRADTTAAFNAYATTFGGRFPAAETY